MECYSVVKKNEIVKFIWTDLERILLSEVNQTQKDQHHMVFPICRAEVNCKRLDICVPFRMLIVAKKLVREILWWFFKGGE